MGFQFCWQDRQFTEEDFENQWDIEFEPEEAAQFDVLKGIDTARCGFATLRKTNEGLFFLCWEERHPELGTFGEFLVTKRKRMIAATWTRRQEEEWHVLRQRMPSRHCFSPITRDVALKLVCFFWLPPEFHLDVGLSNH